MKAKVLTAISLAAAFACAGAFPAFGAPASPAETAYSAIWNGFYGPDGMKRLLRATPARRADGLPDVRIDEREEKVSLEIRLSVDGAAYDAWQQDAQRRLAGLGAACRLCGFKDDGVRVIGGRPYRFAADAEESIRRWELDPSRRKTAVIVRVELFGAKKKSFGRWDTPIGAFTRPGSDDYPLPLRDLNRLRDLPPSIWGWMTREGATGDVESATLTLPLAGLSAFRANAVVEASCTVLSEEDFKPDIDDGAPPALVRLEDDMVPVPGRDFAVCRYEVTQDLWAAIMNSNPSQFKGPNRPVENVSWKDCQTFLAKLNARPHARLFGFVYRLPTEEEWECACRAGGEGPFCRLADGTEASAESLPSIAWFNANSGRETHPVGEKRPNAFGLHDMHGNVWEWTADTEDIFRVARGGCWQGDAERCEASNRNLFYPDHRTNLIGLRLVRTNPR